MLFFGPQALVTLAQRQELLYDFETYKHPIPVDMPLIVLAQGRWGGRPGGYDAQCSTGVLSS